MVCGVSYVDFRGVWARAGSAILDPAGRRESRARFGADPFRRRPRAGGGSDGSPDPTGFHRQGQRDLLVNLPAQNLAVRRPGGHDLASDPSLDRGRWLNTYEVVYRADTWRLRSDIEFNGAPPSDATEGNGIEFFDVYPTANFNNLGFSL